MSVEAFFNECAEYILMGLLVLYFARRVLGAVKFRVWAGGIVGMFVMLGYLTLRYCVNWDAVSTFADIGTLLGIAGAVLIAAIFVLILFRSAVNEFCHEERIARFRRRWRDSKNHWWNM